MVSRSLAALGLLLAAQAHAQDYTVTVTVEPMRATSDDYIAVSAVFAAVLVALCLIWGAKQIFKLFNDRPEA